MTDLQIHQFAYNDDNYGVLIHDPKTGETAAVDAGDAQAYLSAIQTKRWELNQIWITHHHWDHTDGLAELKEKSGATVYGPTQKSKPIAGLDVHLSEGDEIDFAGRKVAILETPGHTLDMINFYLADDAVLFSGDTLFALGCGRIFEGSAPMMWNSLLKLSKLPTETTIYCSHEYTAANAKFALSIDPGNEALQERAKHIYALRDRGESTVPFTLEMELATNPFLRPHDSKIRSQLNMEQHSDEDVFTEIRKRKDNF